MPSPPPTRPDLRQVVASRPVTPEGLWNWVYAFTGVKIARARVAIFGKKNDDEAHGPASMWAICDVQDGNYLLVDVQPRQKTKFTLNRFRPWSAEPFATVELFK